MTGPRSGPEGSAEALRLAAQLTTPPSRPTPSTEQRVGATSNNRDAQVDALLRAQADLQDLVAMLTSRTDEHEFAIGRLQSATFDTA